MGYGKDVGNANMKQDLFYKVPRKVMLSDESLPKQLPPRHRHTCIATYIATALHCDFRTGRGNVAVETIGNMIGIQPRTASKSLRMLNDTSWCSAIKVPHPRGERWQQSVEVATPGESWFPVFRSLVKSDAFKALSPAEVSFWLASLALVEEYDADLAERHFDYTDAKPGRIAAVAGVSRGIAQPTIDRLKELGLMDQSGGVLKVALRAPEDEPLF